MKFWWFLLKVYLLYSLIIPINCQIFSSPPPRGWTLTSLSLISLIFLVRLASTWNIWPLRSFWAYKRIILSLIQICSLISIDGVSILNKQSSNLFFSSAVNFCHSMYIYEIVNNNLVKNIYYYVFVFKEIFQKLFPIIFRIDKKIEYDFCVTLFPRHAFSRMWYTWYKATS